MKKTVSKLGTALSLGLFACASDPIDRPEIGRGNGNPQPAPQATVLPSATPDAAAPLAPKPQPGDLTPEGVRQDGCAVDGDCCAYACRCKGGGVDVRFPTCGDKGSCGDMASACESSCASKTGSKGFAGSATRVVSAACVL